MNDNPNEPPQTFGQWALAAIDDALKFVADKRPDRVLDMHLWCRVARGEGSPDQVVCHACLAGIAMLRHEEGLLRLRPSAPWVPRIYRPEDFPEMNGKYQSLNSWRLGRLSEAACYYYAWPRTDAGVRASHRWIAAAREALGPQMVHQEEWAPDMWFLTSPPYEPSPLPPRQERDIGWTNWGVGVLEQRDFWVDRLQCLRKVTEILVKNDL